MYLGEIGPSCYRCGAAPHEGPCESAVRRAERARMAKLKKWEREQARRRQRRHERLVFITSMLVLGWLVFGLALLLDAVLR